MQIDVKGRNCTVSDELREHVEKRFAKVGKQVSDLGRLEVEVWEERNPAIAERHVAEVDAARQGRDPAGPATPHATARTRSTSSPTSSRARSSATATSAASAANRAAPADGAPSRSLCHRAAWGRARLAAVYTEAYGISSTSALNLGESKRFKEYEKRVARIAAFEPELELESDDELRERDRRAARARASERRVPRRRPARDLRDRARGRQAHDGHAPLRRAARSAAWSLHGGNIAEMKTGEGKTLTATLAGRPQRAGRQGRPRRHRQRLPRPPRRRVDEPDLRRARPHVGRPAEQAGLRGQAGRLRGRRHLRHELRVRLRLPARQHGARRWRRRSSTAGASARTGGRSRCTTSRSSTRSTTSSSTRRARR